MISTVTISTISTVTTIAAMGLTVTVSVAAIVALIALLITRELAGATDSGSPQHLARFLSIGILPLILVFAVIVTAKIVQVLA